MAWYEVDSLTINTGSVAWGDISRTTTDDGNKLGLNEVAATPGFDYEFLFESIPGSAHTFRFKLNGYYEGSAAHTVVAQAWNYTLGSWTNLGNLSSRSSDKTYLFPEIPATDYVSGGQAKIRFYHATSGTVGHYLRIDQLIIEVLTTTTPIPTTPAPTTTPPSTAVPTTTVTTGAPPTTVVGTSPIPPTTTAPTTAAPTTAPPTTVAPTTVIPTTPPPHDAALDLTFNCLADNYAGVPIVEVSISGVSLSASASGTITIEVSISGSVPSASLVDDATISVEVSISGWGIANANKSNWVAWSKIGDVSMVLDRVNDAGRRPMQWSGYVYQTLKLGKNVAIYGSGGVTLAYPVSSPMPTFGFKEILPIGIKNKTAVAGDEFIHFFIDVQGCLYALTAAESLTGVQPDLKRLGYEEYLVGLTNPVLLWDADERRLYISDTDESYIYNEGALTGGYDNLTGLYRVKTDLDGVSPGTVVAKPVEIWTDIIDLEHSGLKSIESVQFDAISEVPLQGAIAFRYENDKDFRTTEWSPINRQGILHRRTAGVEFRLGIKGLDHGDFDLTYIKINFKYIDQRFTRDPKGPLKEY